MRSIVPKLNLNDYPRADLQPSNKVVNENVFFSRSVYDFRSKRLAKNLL